MFNHINLGQWYWYLYNFLKDEEGAYSKRRDMTEYLASFSNPEAVQRVRSARDDAVKVSDDDFMKGVKHFFGRDLPEKMVNDDGKMHAADPRAVMNNTQNDSNNEPTYKDWMNVNLE